MQPAISRTLSRELGRSAGSACALISSPQVECALSNASQRGYSTGQPADGVGSSPSSHGGQGATAEPSLSTAAEGRGRHSSAASSTRSVSPGCRVGAAAVCSARSSNSSSIAVQQRGLHVGQQQLQAAHAVSRSDDDSDADVQSTVRPGPQHTYMGTGHGIKHIFPGPTRRHAASSGAPTESDITWQVVAQQLAQRTRPAGTSSGSMSGAASTIIHPAQQQQHQEPAQGPRHDVQALVALLDGKWHGSSQAGAAALGGPVAAAGDAAAAVLTARSEPSAASVADVACAEGAQQQQQQQQAGLNAHLSRLQAQQVPSSSWQASSRASTAAAEHCGFVMKSSSSTWPLTPGPTSVRDSGSSAAAATPVAGGTAAAEFEFWESSSSAAATAAAPDSAATGASNVTLGSINLLRDVSSRIQQLRGLALEDSAAPAQQQQQQQQQHGFVKVQRSQAQLLQGQHQQHPKHSASLAAHLQDMNMALLQQPVQANLAAAAAAASRPGPRAEGSALVGHQARQGSLADVLQQLAGSAQSSWPRSAAVSGHQQAPPTLLQEQQQLLQQQPLGQPSVQQAAALDMIQQLLVVQQPPQQQQQQREFGQQPPQPVDVEALRSLLMPRGRPSAAGVGRSTDTQDLSAAAAAATADMRTPLQQQALAAHKQQQGGARYPQEACAATPEQQTPLQLDLYIQQQQQQMQGQLPQMPQVVQQQSQTLHQLLDSLLEGMSSDSSSSSTHAGQVQQLLQSINQQPKQVRQRSITLIKHLRSALKQQQQHPQAREGVAQGETAATAAALVGLRDILKTLPEPPRRTTVTTSGSSSSSSSSEQPAAVQMGGSSNSAAEPVLLHEPPLEHMPPPPPQQQQQQQQQLQESMQQQVALLLQQYLQQAQQALPNTAAMQQAPAAAAMEGLQHILSTLPGGQVSSSSSSSSSTPGDLAAAAADAAATHGDLSQLQQQQSGATAAAAHGSLSSTSSVQPQQQQQQQQQDLQQRLQQLQELPPKSHGAQAAAPAAAAAAAAAPGTSSSEPASLPSSVSHENASRGMGLGDIIGALRAHRAAAAAAAAAPTTPGTGTATAAAAAAAAVGATGAAPPRRGGAPGPWNELREAAATASVEAGRQRVTEAGRQRVTDDIFKHVQRLQQQQQAVAAQPTAEQTAQQQLQEQQHTLDAVMQQLAARMGAAQTQPHAWTPPQRRQQQQQQPEQIRLSNLLKQQQQQEVGTPADGPHTSLQQHKAVYTSFGKDVVVDAKGLKALLHDLESTLSSISTSSSTSSTSSSRNGVISRGQDSSASLKQILSGELPAAAPQPGYDRVQPQQQQQQQPSPPPQLTQTQMQMQTQMQDGADRAQADGAAGKHKPDAWNPGMTSYVPPVSQGPQPLRQAAADQPQGGLQPAVDAPGGAAAARLAAETEARMQQVLSSIAIDHVIFDSTGSGKGQHSSSRKSQRAAEAQRKAEDVSNAKRRKEKERERAAAAVAAAERKAEKKAAKKTAAVAAGSAASSRWASKLQQLQQGEPAAAAAAEALAAEASEDEADYLAEDALGETAAPSSSSSNGSGGVREQPRQLRELQMPALCSVRQLAALLGVQVSQLEAVLKEQLGEEVKSEEDLISPESAELAAMEFGTVLLRPPEDAAAEPRPPIVTVMGHVDHGKTSLLDALRSSNVTAGEAGGITQHIGAFEVQMPGSGSILTFLDTPGHAAFGAMRARGAAATDIVVLAVAADDGVMPQTREALAHARAAQVPIVVALTKCDLPQARPDQVKMQLLSEGLELEEFGGDVQCVQTAAKAQLGLRELEEALLLQAEVMELKAPKDVSATGVVVEAQLSKGLGPIATVIVKRGVLKPGDPLVIGTEHGRVRALRDSNGKTLAEAGPGQAVMVSGLRGLPAAGDELLVVQDDARAARMASARSARAEDFRLNQLARMQAEARRQQQALREQEYERKRKLRQRIQEIKTSGIKAHTASTLKVLHQEAHLIEEQKLKAAAGRGTAASLAADTAAAAAAADSSDSLDDGSSSSDAAEAASSDAADAAADGVPVLPPDAPTVTLIIKGDVQGSVEAVTEAVSAAAAGRAAVRFVYTGVGPISMSDVHLAATTGARIVAFNLVEPSGDVDTALRSSKVEVMRHNVIYHLLDEIAAVVSDAEAGGVSGPAGVAEEVLGSALVMAVFPMIKNRQEVGKVAGCRVQEGSLSSGPGVVYRVIRDGQVVFEGPCSSLKQQRSAVTAVGKGNECGVALDDGVFADYKPGDVLQCLQRRTVRS